MSDLFYFENIDLFTELGKKCMLRVCFVCFLFNLIYFIFYGPNYGPWHSKSSH